MSTLAVPRVTAKPLDQDFEQIFREHSQMLYRTAYSMLNNPADAEDVLQTIFLRLLRREFPPNLQKNVKGYLYRAAVNLSLNVIRSRQRHEQIGDADRVDVPADDIASSIAEDTHRLLAEAFAELHPEAAQMLVLRYVHEYSDAEIARLLGTSRGSIAMRLFRSRARLKKLMRESLGEKS